MHERSPQFKPSGGAWDLQSLRSPEAATAGILCKKDFLKTFANLTGVSQNLNVLESLFNEVEEHLLKNIFERLILEISSSTPFMFQS